ncbi:MAG: urea ABC transporter permease subunit UrtB [Candidatus Latescibacterota bacterium]|nr:urea ABC transporter permease subunit UrtB [Candidatus Latescibacterota bacterium]
MGLKSMIGTMVAVWLIVVGAAGGDEWDEADMDRLASGDDEQIKAVVGAMGARFDQAQYVLMQGLFNGEVYRWDGREEQAGLVIVGEEETDDYGDSIVPLYTVYPKRLAIVGKDGNLVKVSLYDLQEVETGRAIRALIQPYLLQMDLSHPDAHIRRIAAENIGNRGSAAQIEVLRHSIETETDDAIERLKRVSLAKLQLADDAVDVRLEAVDQLQELSSPLAIPVLKALLREGESGVFAEPDAGVRARAVTALQSLERFSSFMQVVQTAFIGLSLGSILVLMSLGLAIIYGQMGVINMAHGEFMMIGAYTTFVVQNICLAVLPPAYSDLFFAFSLPLAFLVAGGCGLLLEALVIRRLYSRPLESLLATWGISLIFIQGARSIFGDLTAVKLPQILQGGWEMSPQVILPYNRMFIMGLAIAIVGALMALFFRTRFGLRLRATTQNRSMSACVGVRVRRVDAMAFMLGTGIAGVAGWAMTLVGNVVPNMGQTYIVDSFLVVVTGGVGKLLGTISAGLGIGIFNKLLEPLFEAVYGKVILLGLIILFLQSRPTGLFPARGRGEEL